MSHARQAPTREPVRLDFPDGSIWVRAFAVRFTRGAEFPIHEHGWHQLSYASHGALRVETAQAAWIVPPHRALWLPAGTLHREVLRGQSSIRHLYFAPGVRTGLPLRCAVIDVPPLLRELIVHAAERGALDAGADAQRRLAEVIVDQLAQQSPSDAQQLPMPTDPRALAVARRLLEDPAAADELPALAQRAAASPRTLQRLFEAQTRLSFSRWRQRLRLLMAIEKLGQGASVTAAGLDVGYASVSAFVSAFRREFGASPARFARREPQHTLAVVTTPARSSPGDRPAAAPTHRVPSAAAARSRQPADH